MHDGQRMRETLYTTDIEADFGSNETRQKGNTRTKIPKRPMATPATNTHVRGEVTASKTDHALSGMESAESIVDED